MVEKKSVVVVGSVALDDVQTPFGERKGSLGGSAVYFSVACSLFSDVSIVGVAGEDFPDKHLLMLKKRGIDIKGLKKVKGKTFHWKGKYDFDCNAAETLKTDLNVLAEFNPKLFEYQKKMEYLFLANIDPDIQLQVAKSMDKPKIIAADTMNYWIDSKRKELKKVLKVVDYLLINDAEVRQLGKSANLVKAAKKILTYGPKVIIVKQGEYGVTMFYGKEKGSKIEVFSAPAIPLETLKDPTGAGDSFAGAFMGYLASRNRIDKNTIRKAVAMGSVVASYAVEGFSVDTIKKVTMKNVIGRYAHLKRIAYFDNISKK